jgi:sRNA-binding protein
MIVAMRPWLLALALSAGCGPFAYANQVWSDAGPKVEEARRAEAEKYSPYWWTRATQYLHMAREVAAHADFQGANRFGRLAAEAAVKAREEAELAKSDPSRQPVNPTKELAPAKEKAEGGVAPAKE